MTVYKVCLRQISKAKGYSKHKEVQNWIDDRNWYVCKRIEHRDTNAPLIYPWHVPITFSTYMSLLWQ